MNVVVVALLRRAKSKNEKCNHGLNDGTSIIKTDFFLLYVIYCHLLIGLISLSVPLLLFQS